MVIWCKLKTITQKILRFKIKAVYFPKNLTQFPSTFLRRAVSKILTKTVKLKSGLSWPAWNWNDIRAFGRRIHWNHVDALGQLIYWSHFWVYVWRWTLPKNRWKKSKFSLCTWSMEHLVDGALGRHICRPNAPSTKCSVPANLAPKLACVHSPFWEHNSFRSEGRDLSRAKKIFPVSSAPENTPITPYFHILLNFQQQFSKNR